MREQKVREIVVEDQAQVLELCRSRPFPDTAFRHPEKTRQGALALVEQAFPLLGSDPKTRALGLFEGEQLMAYTLFRTGEIESITREPQTVMGDYYTPEQEQFEALFSESKKVASSAGDHYLVFDLFSDSPQLEPWAQSLGFVPELIRVVRQVTPDHKGASDDRFRVRRAKELELLFIIKLVSQNSPLYRPAGRTIDPAKLQQGFVNSYSSLSARDNKKVPLLIESVEGGQPLGYLIVEPNRVPGGELTLYIYDIAVLPETRGQGLARYLLGGGESLLARMGGGVFYGDISADNTPAVKTQQALGFSIDSTRYGARL